MDVSIAATHAPRHGDSLEQKASSDETHPLQQADHGLDPLSPESCGLSAAFFVLGVGSLLPYNALLSVIDLYSLMFPTLSIAQFITNAYTLPVMVVGIVATMLPPPPSLRPLCIFFSYSTLFLVSLLFPLLTVQQTPFLTRASSLASSQFASLVVLTAILGAANVLEQIVMFGVVTLFPTTRHTTMYNAGGAFASLLLSILRIFTRLLFDEAHSAESLLPGFRIFFLVCTLACLSCVIVFSLAFVYSPSFIRHVRNVWQAPQSPSSKPSFSQRLEKLSTTMSHIRATMLCQFLCFSLTLLLFPSIMTVPPLSLRPHLSDLQATWFPLLVVTAFALGDTLGRLFFSASLASSNPRYLTYLTALRILLFPLLLLQWTSSIPSTAPLLMLSVFLHGYFGGFLMNMAFVIAPAQTSVDRREAAGRCVFIVLTLGLFFGTASAWLLQSLLEKRSLF